MTEYQVFYERYRQPLFGHLLRLCGDADLSLDIVQESFTRYLQHYREASPKAVLLFRIAHNALNDHYRKRKNESGVDVSQIPAPTDAEHGAVVRERYRQVLAAMQQLGDRERELLSLALSQHLNYREIASVAHISEANVKVTIHRARKKLRSLLDGGQA